MTSTLCQSAALDRIVAPWAAKIATFFATIVETILAILHELGACCREASPLRHKAGFPPPAASALHLLVRKRSPDFERAVMKPEAKDIERVLKGY
jgi:hypothetical protein